MFSVPGLNKVARKLNIDCAPAMTGFDFNGGWTHPVFDGFVVCEEFSEIITDAWVKVCSLFYGLILEFVFLSMTTY